MRRVRLIACVVAVLACSAGTAAAHFTSSPSAATTVETLAVGSAGPAQAATVDACATVDVTWQRAANATTYAVEVQRNGGTWQVLVGDSGDVTAASDTGATLGSTVAYRVTPRHAPSGWTGTPATTAVLNC